VSPYSPTLLVSFHASFGLTPYCLIDLMFQAFSTISARFAIRFVTQNAGFDAFLFISVPGS